MPSTTFFDTGMTQMAEEQEQLSSKINACQDALKIARDKYNKCKIALNASAKEVKECNKALDKSWKEFLDSTKTR